LNKLPNRVQFDLQLLVFVDQGSIPEAA